MKPKYQSPIIIEDFLVEIKTPVLASSVIDNDTEVKSVGQEVENHTINTFDANGNSLWYN